MLVCEKGLKNKIFLLIKKKVFLPPKVLKPKEAWKRIWSRACPMSKYLLKISKITLEQGPFGSCSNVILWPLKRYLNTRCVLGHLEPQDLMNLKEDIRSSV